MEREAADAQLLVADVGGGELGDADKELDEVDLAVLPHAVYRLHHSPEEEVGVEAECASELWRDAHKVTKSSLSACSGLRLTARLAHLRSL